MSLGTLDQVLLTFSLLATLVIGIYHGVIGFKQTSVDYMMGGRMMMPLPLAMSLTVGTVSAITIVGNAGEMYAYGTQLWIMDVGIAIGMFLVAKYFIPILYPLNFISVYKYIECRFKSIWLRRCTVFLTLGGAYLFTGFLLLPPSYFLKSFTGLNIKINIVITGLICSLYSSVGGVKAVVYTDVLQSLIMIIGSLAIVIQGSIHVGGIKEVWDIAQRHDRIDFLNFDPNPFQRHSFWLVIINGLFFSLSTYGVNQSQTQRAFSSGSTADAQKVIYIAIGGIVLLRGLINFSGLVIFANYSTCDPLTKDPAVPKPNIEVVVLYVLDHLTDIPGLAGLFVASIYAAVLSSVSTQVNSMTALLWEDFLKPIPYFKSFSEVKTARIQKAFVILNGVVGVLSGLILCKFVSYLEYVLKITGAVWGPMIGLFFIGMFLPWINAQGASLGFLGSIVVSVWIIIEQLSVGPAPFLPMSHEGCLDESDARNVSYLQLFSSNNSVSANTTIEEIQGLNESEVAYGIYEISYCLNYLWGFFTCVIIAVLFTLTTGSNSEEDVERKLIHAGVWKYFSAEKNKKCCSKFTFGKGKRATINDANREDLEFQINA